jgi:GNAT superfamily N-acetyltransferase
VTIKRAVSPPAAAELEPLVLESESEGCRFLRRLNDELATGKNQFDRPGEALVLARDAGRLVGVCGLNVDPYADSANVGRVRHLYVVARWRRQGLARRLVEHVIDVARTTFDELRLRTDSPEAARFYDTMGFQRPVGVPSCTHVLRIRGGSR